MPTQERLEEIADRLDIRKLRADYAHHLDAGQWDEYVGLFTTDAVVEYSTGSHRLEGREEIARFAREEIDYDFSFHTAQMPRIEVDGDTATGVWYLCVYYRLPSGEAGWGLGTYEDGYRRVDGEWKFSRVRSSIHADTGTGLLG